MISPTQRGLGPEGFLFQLYLQDPSNQRERKKTTVDGNLSKKNMDLDVTDMLWNWDTSPAAVDGMRTYRSWSVQVYTSKRVSSTALVVSLVMWHTLAALASTAFGYGFREKYTMEFSYDCLYPVVRQGDRCGAKGIHIPYWMGGLLELRMEFPTHIW